MSVLQKRGYELSASDIVFEIKKNFFLVYFDPTAAIVIDIISHQEGEISEVSNEMKTLLTAAAIPQNVGSCEYRSAARYSPTQPQTWLAAKKLSQIGTTLDDY